LLSVFRQTGTKPDQLDKYSLPYSMTYVWEAFQRLHSTREYTEFGSRAITYTEIKSWMDLFNMNLLPKEIECIKILDNMFLSISSKRKQD
jgi:hypothetical protein